MSLGKRTIAEFLGTFWLVLGGCGSAVLAAAFPSLLCFMLGPDATLGRALCTMGEVVTALRKTG